MKYFKIPMWNFKFNLFELIIFEFEPFFLIFDNKSNHRLTICTTIFRLDHKTFRTWYAPNVVHVKSSISITFHTPISSPQRSHYRTQTLIGLWVVICPKQTFTCRGTWVEDSWRIAGDLCGGYDWLRSELCERLLCLGRFIAVLLGKLRDWR